jgi:general secretion pathway protein D
MRGSLRVGSVVACLLTVSLWMWASSVSVEAARVTGREGVTPTGVESLRQGTPAGEQPPEGAPGEKSPGAGERYVTIDFDDVDILLFIKFISELTEKNFVVDKAVRGKVTVISPTKISVEEAYKVFESVLEVNGFTTVQAGSIIKVVPSVEARTKDVETSFSSRARDRDDKVITQLIPLTHANPEEVKKIFAPFISKSSVVVSYPPTGTLIIADVQSNIQRLLKIIDAIDIEGVGEMMAVIPLEFASAANLAKSLNTLFQSAAQEARKKGQADVVLVKIVPDERTNTLIVLASEADIRRIKELVALIDKQTPPGEGDIRVIYLEHANAEDLTKVLMAIPLKQTGESGEPGKAPVISKEVQIVADAATNSLVITANKEDYLVLENVIRQLDIPRRMVYLEALIMEVSVNKFMELGTEWGAGEDFSVDGRTIGVFGGRFPTTPLLATGSIPSGFSLGVIGDTITVGNKNFLSLGALIRFMQTEEDIQILSTPQIMTTDNEEAQIQVVKNVPFQTRADTTDTLRDYSTYEYKDVGVTLTITPQINRERFVRLKIEQEVSQVMDDTDQERPTTLKRLAKTTVIVKDGNTIVIGGLIDELKNRSDYRVPCLGGVPGLGWAFKTVTNKHEAQNLFIFLTPHIVENQQDAKRVHDMKREQIDSVKEGSVKMRRGLEKMIFEDDSATEE